METESGKPITTPVDIKIMEMANTIDMLAMHSPTVSNGQMLESGGSWYISATSNGENVKLKNGKSFELGSNIISQPGYSVFYGEKNADGAINWKPSNTSFINTNSDIMYDASRKQALSFNSTNNLTITSVDLGNTDFYYRKGEKRYFDYWVNNNDKRVLCEEVWDFDMYKITRTKILDKGFKQKSAGDDWMYDELKEKQMEALTTMFEDGEFVDRCRVFNSKEKEPITYEFIYTHKGDIRQLVIDSIITTPQCKTIPEKLKMLIYKKMNAYSKANYERLFRLYAATEQLNRNSAMVARVNNFGWINCDRFYNSPAEKILCKTNIRNLDKSKKVVVYLLFKNIKSLMPASVDASGNYAFVNVPVGEQAMAVAIGSDGYTNYFGKSDYAAISKDNPLSFDLQKVNNDELKDMMSNLK